MNKNRFAVIAAIISFTLIVCLIVSTTIYRMKTFSDSVNEALQEFSLDTVTDEEVVEKVVATMDKSRQRCSGEASGAHFMGYRKFDYDRCQYTIEKIRGFYVVSASNVENAKIKLKISSNIYDGKGKIAIIQDKTLVEYIDFGASVTREYEVTGESLFLVKIICEDAKIDLTVERQITK